MHGQLHQGLIIYGLMGNGSGVGGIIITAGDIGRRHVQDIMNTGEAIGNKEEMDGIGFRDIGINSKGIFRNLQQNILGRNQWKLL